MDSTPTELQPIVASAPSVIVDGLGIDEFEEEFVLISVFISPGVCTCFLTATSRSYVDLNLQDPVPSPPSWPKWSPLAHQRAYRQTARNASSRWRHLPLALVPQGWSNDFRKDFYSWQWHEYYGGYSLVVQ